MNYRLSALALGATLLVGCASSSSGDRPQGRSDPLEGFNRTMFNFNFTSCKFIQLSYEYAL